jgi:hypothetical protein
MKVKMVATATWTYEADSEHYGTEDPHDMAAMDEEQHNNASSEPIAADNVHVSICPFLPTIKRSTYLDGYGF